MSSPKRYPPVPFFKEILPAMESSPIPETSKKPLEPKKSSNVTSTKGGLQNVVEKKSQNNKSLGTLQYQRKPNNSTAANGQKAVLGPLTLTKETVNPLPYKYELGKLNKQVSLPPWHPLYFQPENAQNQKPKRGSGNSSTNPKEKVDTNSKNTTIHEVSSFKSNKTQEGSDSKKGNIVLTSSGSNKRKSSETDPSNFQLISDLPTMDVFQAFLSKQYRNTEERYSELQHQLGAMIEKSKEDVMDPNYPLNSFTMVQGNMVEEVFHWCKILNVNTETFFRTLELFDRFCVLFNAEMNGITPSMDKTTLFECKKRMLVQIPLRICSCIMLASKLHSNLEYPSVMLDKVKTALSKEGKVFTLKAVAESEIRVLRVLKFRAQWVSPYDLTEQLIAMMELTPQRLQHFYAVALLYLHYSYIRHAEIYAKVDDIYKTFLLPIGSQTASRDAFKRLIEYNAPLRAAAVVAAAGFHVNDTFQASCTQKLSELISEPVNRIATMARLLLHMVCKIHPHDISKIE